MTIETLAAYALAYLALSLIPGPSVLMVMTQALTRGKAAAFACILGDLAGGVVIIAAAYLGIGALIAASSTAFMALKWGGVAYLAWLGTSQLFAAHRMSRNAPAPQPKPGASWRAGFVTGVLNPKAIMFYMAFLAQFLDPTAPTLPQVLVLGATSTVIVAIVLTGYALLAAKARAVLAGPTAQQRIAYASGGAMLGGSVWLAATR